MGRFSERPYIAAVQRPPVRVPTLKPQLKIRNLIKSYDGKYNALDEVSLEVYPGDFVILLGLSGSGKSTLLRCINRLVEPNGGEIFFEDRDIIKLKGLQLRRYRREIGMVFQQFNLVKNMSVIGNVLTGRLGYQGLLERYSTQDWEDARLNLEKVGLSEYEHRKVKQLSGGQQQRVGIARALMQNPKLILADEPVASLDPATADSVMQYLGKINAEGITVICSLHFLSLAKRYGTKVFALKEGKVAFEGDVSEIDNNKFKQIYGEEAKEI